MKRVVPGGAQANTSCSLLSKTGEMVKNVKLKTPFKKGIPGKDWFQGFKGRYPELTMKKPQKWS